MPHLIPALGKANAPKLDTILDHQYGTHFDDEIIDPVDQASTDQIIRNADLILEAHYKK